MMCTITKMTPLHGKDEMINTDFMMRNGRQDDWYQLSLFEWLQALAWYQPLSGCRLSLVPLVL
jgi:hypothetical protein